MTLHENCLKKDQKHLQRNFKPNLLTKRTNSLPNPNIDKNPPTLCIRSLYESEYDIQEESSLGIIRLIERSKSELPQALAQKTAAVILESSTYENYYGCCLLKENNICVTEDKDGVITGAISYLTTRKRFCCINLGTTAEINWLLTAHDNEDIKKEYAVGLLETVITNVNNEPNVRALYFNYDITKHAKLAALLQAHGFITREDTGLTTQIWEKKLKSE